MTIQIKGWQDHNGSMREQIVRDVIDIMFRYFHNDALFKNDLQIINIHTSNCLWADESPCTHFDRSRICLNVNGAFWCQFVHQLSHELCHCSTSRLTLPQKIKWFDEFICSCASYLVETIIATDPTQKYEYMFLNGTREAFSDYLKIESDGHIYYVDNIQDFFANHREMYQQDENLIKKHDVYVRTLFELLKGDFSGLSFVGKMYLVQTDNDMIIKQYLQRLVLLCNDKEKFVIYQICKLFDINLKREMKDSGISWVGEIPKEWRILRNKYIFKITKDIVLPSKNYKLLSLTTTGIKEKDENDNGGKVPENFNGYQIVKENDLVMCLFDLDCSAVFSGLSSYNGMISPAYKILKVKKGIANEQYYRYWFEYVGSKRFYKQYSKSLRYTLNADEFNRLFSLLPPLNGQQKIAEFLDRECEKIDELKADIQSQIDTLEQYKRSVITEAVTKGLNSSAPMKDSKVWYGKIPFKWTELKGKYIFKQRNDRGNNGCLQLLSPTQKYGVIPQDKYEELTGMNAVKLNDNTNYALLKTIHQGDYCISLRSFQGGFEYSEYEGVVSPAYQVFYPIINIDEGYYKYLFKEKGFIDVMNSYTMSLRDGKNIAFNDFGNTFIPVPPIDEQQSIAEYLDEKCAEIEKIITDKKMQIETLDEYKKSLIYEYVTGKKEVI